MSNQVPFPSHNDNHGNNDNHDNTDYVSSLALTPHEEESTPLKLKLNLNSSSNSISNDECKYLVDNVSTNISANANVKMPFEKDNDISNNSTSNESNLSYGSTITASIGSSPTPIFQRHALVHTHGHTHGHSHGHSHSHGHIHEATHEHNHGHNHVSAYPKDDQTITLRRIAIDLSLYCNLIILISKFYAYIETMSLSVLAALTDSLLDVVSQLVLNYTESNSSKSRSSALYPAGAARLEPVGVLTCAALMGMASFEILKESMESLAIHGSSVMEEITSDMLSVYGMLGIVFLKLALYFLCMYAIPMRDASTSVYTNSNGNSNSSDVVTSTSTSTAVKQKIRVSDPTLEALALDHWNDCLSNLVAAAALFAALLSPDLWFLDPVGAILISIYIIYSWYETGKEQIEQLTGKSAPDEFIDELNILATNFDSRMIVDVVRAYHFGPKFLVELEVVLPKDTLLFESHDLGMELQYEIEGREEVERCFVHIDYEQRPYDEHVVSKVPELRAKYRPSASSSNCHSV
jgi:cation diffusion facilitator family transporter